MLQYSKIQHFNTAILSTFCFDQLYFFPYNVGLLVEFLSINVNFINNLSINTVTQ